MAFDMDEYLSKKLKPSGFLGSLHSAYGPAQKARARALAPGAAAFGIAAGIGFCWALDWKVVMEYFPYYGSIYPPVKGE